MEINNRPLPILTPGGSRPTINLPHSDTPPPPLTQEQKDALEKLRDQLKEQPPVITVTPQKTSLIDEVI